MPFLSSIEFGKGALRSLSALALKNFYNLCNITAEQGALASLLRLELTALSNLNLVHFQPSSATNLQSIQLNSNHLLFDRESRCSEAEHVCGWRFDPRISILTCKRSLFPFPIIDRPRISADSFHHSKHWIGY